MRNVIFYLGMGALFTHELDAVAHHEWRVLPLINLLPEEIALNAFILAHVPLFAIAIAAIASSKVRVQKKQRLLLLAFLCCMVFFTNYSPAILIMSFTLLPLFFSYPVAHYWVRYIWQWSSGPRSEMQPNKSLKADVINGAA